MNNVQMLTCLTLCRIVGYKITIYRCMRFVKNLPLGNFRRALPSRIPPPRRSFAMSLFCSSGLTNTIHVHVTDADLRRRLVSGQPPLHPVLSTKSGHVYERTLVLKYLADNDSRDPITGDTISVDDLVDIKTGGSLSSSLLAWLRFFSRLARLVKSPTASWVTCTWRRT